MNDLIPSNFSVNVTFNDPTSIMYLLGLFVAVFFSYFIIQSLFK
jgi:hypothetical protein